MSLIGWPLPWGSSSWIEGVRPGRLVSSMKWLSASHFILLVMRRGPVPGGRSSVRARVIAVGGLRMSNGLRVAIIVSVR